MCQVYRGWRGRVSVSAPSTAHVLAAVTVRVFRQSLDRTWLDRGGPDSVCLVCCLWIKRLQDSNNDSLSSVHTAYGSVLRAVYRVHAYRIQIQSTSLLQVHGEGVGTRERVRIVQRGLHLNHEVHRGLEVGSSEGPSETERRDTRVSKTQHGWNSQLLSLPMLRN